MKSVLPVLVWGEFERAADCRPYVNPLTRFRGSSPKGRAFDKCRGGNLPPVCNKKKPACMTHTGFRCCVSDYMPRLRMTSSQMRRSCLVFTPRRSSPSSVMKHSTFMPLRAISSGTSVR